MTRQNHGYNYEFKCLMEGIEVKFISASISSTPNGSEATINIHSTREAFFIKPKTAIQIFYREWWTVEKTWRLLFDGFMSRFDKQDSTQGGAGIAVTCRDFRMDIRKAPCAIVFGGTTGAEMLGTQTLYNSGGLFGNMRIPLTSGTGSIRVFDYSRLANIFSILSLVAGTAQNLKDIAVSSTSVSKPADQVASESQAASGVEKFENLTNEQLVKLRANSEQMQKVAASSSATVKAVDTKTTREEAKTEYGKIFDVSGNNATECHWWLDAFIKGVWLEAVGGTYIGQFINRRLRVEKRMAAMKNEAGYRLFVQQRDLQSWGAGYVMGNARFTSIEAMIMRVAGLFMTRPYSMCNPPLIDLDDTDARKYFVSDRVYENFVKSSIYGNRFLAPFTILTPPLEFTAPPNCNVFLPAVYDNVSWQHDDDAEITRGYYDVISSFPSNESTDAWSFQVQVPNTVLNFGKKYLDYLSKNEITEYSSKEDKAKYSEAYIMAAPSMSLEERYKGINIATGSVSDYMARSDLARNIHHAIFDAKKAAEIEIVLNEIATLSEEAQSANKESIDLLSKIGAQTAAGEALEVIENVKKQKDKSSKKAAELKAKIEAASKNLDLQANVTNILERHATIKFLNQKFAGRVTQVSMQLNPFPIAGLPGVVIADYDSGTEDSNYGFGTRKSVLGTVQQVSHVIHSAGQAVTTVVMNNSRYVDEPTYMSVDGLPTYMEKTDTSHAEYDTVKMKYTKFDDDTYFVGDDKPKFDYVRPKKIPVDTGVDILLPESKAEPTYKYAKDFTTVSREGLQNGQSNASNIDQEYAPNLITRFYVKCFGQRADDSLMIGNTGKKAFMYDSIHEAITNLESRADVVYDYQRAFEFCQRDVVSYAGFYSGLLDLALVDPATRTIIQPATKAEFLKYSDQAYQVVSMTDAQWSEYVALCESNSKDPDAGPSALNEQYKKQPVPASPMDHWAMITEHTPKTAFIKERREMVEKYKQSIEPFGRGVRYAYD